jgi:hypothetical protein
VAAITEVAHRFEAAVDDTRRQYANGADRPIGAYAVLLSVYAALVGVLSFVVRRRKAPLPERFGAADLALLAVATHKVSRLVTKDSVTAAVRAPFTEFKEPAGEGEVNEDVRGTGLRHAVGELLTCPFCFSQWAATAFAFGLVLAPRATRLAASVLVAVTGADVMQYGFSALKKLEG